MKQIVNEVGKCVGKIISQCIKVRICLNLYNYLFERSAPQFTKFCVKYIELPNVDFEWKVKLLNKKIIKTLVIRDEKLTREFALSYNWHSLGLKQVEAIVNNYYPQDIPWIDVGSNMGLRSLYALSMKKPVYFVEPNAVLNQYNLQRCVLNNFQNYNFLEFGASDNAGTVDFFIDHTSYCSTLEVDVLNDECIQQKMSIQVETLDTLFEKELSVFKTVCVKIDVEGHELKVLNGASKLMKMLSPTMIIEVNEKGAHLSDLISITNQYGYTVYEIGNFKNKKFLKKLDIEKKNGLNLIKFNDFLFIKDKGLLESLRKNILN